MPGCVTQNFIPYHVRIIKEHKESFIMCNWEYLVLNRAGERWSDDSYNGRNSTEKLTELGGAGWELVSVCYDGSSYNFYLKKSFPKAKTSSRKSKAKSAEE
jgi:hypothetical protein